MRGRARAAAGVEGNPRSGAEYAPPTAEYQADWSSQACGSGNNLLGRLHPPVHADFREVSDELLLYTSRYYTHCESRLRRLGLPEVRLDGYRAQRLSAAQRASLGSILCRPADATALAQLQALIDEVRERRPHAQQVQDRTQRACTHHYCRSPVPQLPAGLSPIEPLLHLARRFRFRVTIQGRLIRLSMRALLRCLDSPEEVVRHNIWLALYWARMYGYHLHNSDHDRATT